MERYDVYEPREDSYLILEQVRLYAHGNVLDMGTGSGILAINAAKKANFVIGLDINPISLEFARAQAEKSDVGNIIFAKSDLFSFFENLIFSSSIPDFDSFDEFKKNKIVEKIKEILSQKFDLIIFNPPYLPEDPKEPEESKLMTTGGKKGYEILERFFSKVNNYLNENGKVLIVFSTLTNIQKVHEILETYCFNYQKLSEKQIPFETLYCYLAQKSELLKNLEGKGVKDIKKLAKGHRGIVYTGMLDGKKVCIKKQREDITAIERISNESRWLKFLNRKGIGPKFLFFEDDFFVYEYVDGLLFKDWVSTASKKEVVDVLKNVFEQMFILDSMNANKEEMHHPWKHIIVNKRGKAILIDFERMHVTQDPKNVSQFCQFVTSSKMTGYLKEKGIKIDKRKMISLAKNYKKDFSRERFEEIIKLIK